MSRVRFSENSSEKESIDVLEKKQPLSQSRYRRITVRVAFERNPPPPPAVHYSPSLLHPPPPPPPLLSLALYFPTDLLENR
ncbi:hypothetical protein KPH14_004839 [Odynerus spinipes]|uniref:Uncharacterized protein n=1 Tax=Odynerus spinipes TaxID=1348599 RepID=A0AAD9RNQ3_9HYME|nr:hypothetical protein KPH14_004839 [Odynerus spinipes]